jgi:transposase
MDLATVQSGMFRGQSRISKYGNARLRRTLWMAGQTAVLKRTNSFRDKFERYISKDRHNAICAARPTPPSRPRWRAPCTPWSITANPIAPSSRG